jgi:hypothetical protein
MAALSGADSVASAGGGGLGGSTTVRVSAAARLAASLAAK